LIHVSDRLLGVKAKGSIVFICEYKNNMEDIVVYSKSTSGGDKSESRGKALDFDETGSRSSAFDLKTLEEALGPHFAPIKRLEEHYLKKIGVLESELERLRNTVIKSPPMPRELPVIPKTTGDLYESGLAFENYRKQYLIAESNNNGSLRLKLHAWLHILRDFGVKNTSLMGSVNDYFSDASEKIDSKINQYMIEAQKAEMSLPRWVNLHLD
jgi:hypothetical protein